MATWLGGAKPKPASPAAAAPAAPDSEGARVAMQGGRFIKPTSIRTCSKIYTVIAVIEPAPMEVGSGHFMTHYRPWLGAREGAGDRELSPLRPRLRRRPAGCARGRLRDGGGAGGGAGGGR
jgi:hypothetical protein